jgi:hypothetical protein
MIWLVQTRWPTDGGTGTRCGSGRGGPARPSPN